MLDPDPPPERIAEVLGRYRFRDMPQAYQEPDGRWRPRRFAFCRRAAAGIFWRRSPRGCSQAIAATPDPDFTLVNLSKVSDSLGGKGVLWELFSFNPPTLQLYVELCCVEPVPVGHPDQQPRHDRRADGQPAAGQAADAASCSTPRWPNCAAGPKTSSRSCTASRTRSSCASACATSWARSRSKPRPARCRTSPRLASSRSRAPSTSKLVAKLGEPTIAEGRRRRPSRASWSILAMGKFGGRELNYHSDLDLVFLYEADGTTVHAAPQRAATTTTTNQHFFSELGQRIIKVASQLGPYGRLYEIDPRLRPTGKSGPLATSLAEFRRYFAEGQGQLWERQALCKARVVFGSPRTAGTAMDAVQRSGLRAPPGSPTTPRRVRQMRGRLEATAAPATSSAALAGWSISSSSCRCCSSSTAATIRRARARHAGGARAPWHAAGISARRGSRVLDRAASASCARSKPAAADEHHRPRRPARRPARAGQAGRLSATKPRPAAGRLPALPTENRRRFDRMIKAPERPCEYAAQSGIATLDSATAMHPRYVNARNRSQALWCTRQDENLAIAHATGAGDLDDLANDLFPAAVVNPQSDLYLGQEGQRVFAVAILVEIAFLPAVAFDLANAAGFERRTVQASRTFSARNGLTMATICFIRFAQSIARHLVAAWC